MRFEEFRSRLEGAESPKAALQFVQSLLDGVSNWQADQCRDWLTHLIDLTEPDVINVEAWYPEGLEAEAYERPPYDLTPEDVTERLVRLIEIVLARMAALHEPNPMAQIAGWVEELACQPETLDLPRRYLVPAYERWIDNNFIPGLWGYRAQVVEKATLIERIRITEAMRCSTVVEDPDLADTWIYAELDGALGTQEGARLVPRWVKHLREGLSDRPDPSADAFVSQHERRLQNLLDELGLPVDIADHLCSPTLNRSRASAAVHALNASDDQTFSVDTELLRSVIARDFRLLRPVLVPGVEAAASPDARDVILAYQRLLQTGGASTFVACAMLSLAVEKQLEWALARDLPPKIREKIRECALNELARFVSGRRVGKLESVSLTHTPNKKLVTFLERVGRLRNDVHHHPQSLAPQGRHDLERAVLGTDGAGILLMPEIARLRCRVDCG